MKRKSLLSLNPIKLLAVAFLFITSSLVAQIELPQDMVKAVFTVEQNGDEATIIATITVRKKWHINAIVLPKGTFGLATDYTLVPSANYKAIGGIIEPKPIEKFDEAADELLAYHEGTFKLKRKIKVLSKKDFKLNGEFYFQTCNDVRCLPDYTMKFTVDVKGVSSEAKSTEASESTNEKFKDTKGDFAKDDRGVDFVKSNNKWHEVPKGNSPEFYQKYLALTRKN